MRGPASRGSYGGDGRAAPLTLFDGHRRGRDATGEDYPSSPSSGEEERKSRRRPPPPRAPPRRAPRAPPRVPPRRAPAPKKTAPTSAALVPYAPARTGRLPNLGDEIEVEVECEGVTNLVWRKAQVCAPRGELTRVTNPNPDPNPDLNPDPDPGSNPDPNPNSDPNLNPDPNPNQVRALDSPCEGRFLVCVAFASGEWDELFVEVSKK